MRSPINIRTLRDMARREAFEKTEVLRRAYLYIARNETLPIKVSFSFFHFHFDFQMALSSSLLHQLNTHIHTHQHLPFRISSHD